MKKVAAILLCVILLSGCTAGRVQKRDVSTDILPYEMDFTDFAVSLEGYYIDETISPEGNKLVTLHIKLEFDDSVSQRGVKSIIKDDLFIWVSTNYADSDTEDIRVNLDADNFWGTGCTVYDNVVYYDKLLTIRTLSSSIEGESMIISFFNNTTADYQTFNTVISADNMIKVDENGNITTGESAQGFINDKNKLAGETPAVTP